MALGWVPVQRLTRIGALLGGQPQGPFEFLLPVLVSQVLDGPSIELLELALPEKLSTLRMRWLS